MKTHLKTLSLVALLCGAALTSCEKDIDADIPAPDPFLSTACNFSPDSVWTLHVAHSAHILDDLGPAPVTNAVVEIMEDGALLETLVYTPSPFYTSGTYKGTTYPQLGKQYSVKISVPGYDDLTAVSEVPTPIAISSTAYRDSAINNGSGWWSDEITVRLQDPPGERNFYAVFFAYPDTFDMGTDTLVYWSTAYVVSPDNGLTVADYQGHHLLSDELLDGRTIEMKFSIDSWIKQEGRLLRAFLATLSEEQYRFMVTSNAYQMTNGNPFAEPVQIHSNVNGGVGIFSGYSSVSVPLY